MDHLVADQVIRDVLNELNYFFTWIQFFVETAAISIFIMLLHWCIYDAEICKSSRTINRITNRPSGTGSCKRGS